MGLVGRSHVRLAAGIALVAASMSNSAIAQETVEGTVEEESGGATLLERLILGSGDAPPGSPADTPLATRTTAEEIEDNQIDDIADLGNTTEPGVNVGADGNSVNVRGLEADRVLTTMDGIPIPYLENDARDSISGLGTYNFSSLGTIDIVRGSDSSRGGSGALGGVVVLRTLEPEDLLSGDDDFGGFVRTTYDSADESLKGTVAAAGRRNGTAVLFQGGYTYGHETDNMGTVGGQGASRTLPNPMDFDEHNLLFKLRNEFGAGHMLGLTAERFRDNTETEKLTEEGSTFSDLNGDNMSERNRISLDYRYEAPDFSGLVDRADLKLYWQQVKTTEGEYGTRTGTLAGPWQRSNELEENAYGIVGSLENSFATGMAAHDVTFGGNISYARYGQYSAGEDACDTLVSPPSTCMFYHNNQSDMPDVDGYELGLYGDDKISFGDSGFSLTPGLRFDWYDYRPQETADYLDNSGAAAGLPDARSDYQFSPKLRAEYEANPALTVYGQWSMGFKSPSVTQLYLNYDNAPFYRQIGNPDLEPETSNGFEIGVNLGDDRFGGRVSGFYNKYRNFIDTVTDTTNPMYLFGSFKAENIDRVTIYGAEAEAHKYFDNGFSIQAAVVYAHGENEETGDFLESVPPLKGIVGIGYDADQWGADLRAIGVAAVDPDSTAQFKPDGYGIVNLTGWLEPERLNGLRIAGGVYNLFDEEYYDALKHRDVDLTSSSYQPKTYYSEPGRTFKISVTQKF